VSAEGRRKVAVIGAGPAGLSAAHDLALLGYAVTVFEASEEPGGMMRFGIPEYRLPRSVIRAEIDKIVLAAGAVGRKRVRALAIAIVVWFVAVVLFDVAALGLASLLPSGTASRVLVATVIVNPVGAVRTGSLLATEGTAAFGAASLAFLRFTRGEAGAAIALAGSIALWIVVPVALAARRLGRVDL
jgi:Cu-processing system permease protein